MKFVLIFTLLFPIYLFGESSNKTDEYTKGINYYKNGDFEKCYTSFSQIYLENLSDTNFNFYFGRSAYETGHYEMALAAFERVEMQEDANIRNKLEMARTYYMLKMFEDSENAFKEVLANPNIPNNIRTNIEVALSRVSKVQQTSFTYARAMMGIIYDSNVNYGSLGDYEYGGGNLAKVDEKADIALELYANAVNIYDIGNKNGLAIKNSLAFYLKEYLKEKDFNSMYIAYTPSILYKETKYTIDLALQVDALLLNHQKYLQTFAFVPTLEYKHSTTLNSLLLLKYQMKKFTQSSLDANRYELSYGLQKVLSPRSYVQGNIYFINESKVTGDDIYVNFTEYKTNISYTNQFFSDYGADFSAQLRLRNYSDYSIGFGSQREDIGGLLNANFTMALIPTLQANLRTSYEYVNSNQGRFTYAKYTIFAGLAKTF